MVINDNQLAPSTPPVNKNNHHTDNEVMQEGTADQHLPDHEKVMQDSQDASQPTDNNLQDKRSENRVSELVKDEAYFMSKYAELDELFQSEEYAQDYEEYKQHTETSERIQLAARQSNQQSLTEEVADSVEERSVNFDKEMASSNQLNTVTILAALGEEPGIVHAYGGDNTVETFRNYDNNKETLSAVNSPVATTPEPEQPAILEEPAIEEELQINIESMLNYQHDKQGQTSSTLNQRSTAGSDNHHSDNSDNITNATDARASTAIVERREADGDLTEDEFNQMYGNIDAYANIDTDVPLDNTETSLKQDGQSQGRQSIEPNSRLNSQTSQAKISQSNINYRQDKAKQSIFDRILYGVIGAIVFGFLGLVIDFIVTIIRSFVGSGAGMLWLFAPLLLCVGFVVGLLFNGSDDSVGTGQASASLSNEVMRGITIALFLSLGVWIVLLFFS